jgi:hypothetical protein
MNPKRKTDSASPPSHKPNSVPRDVRLWNIALGLSLLSWSAFSFHTGSVDLWGRRLKIGHFHGGPAVLMALAGLCGALVLLSEVVDHYDTRNNESWYANFRWLLLRICWCFAAAALITHAILFFMGAPMGPKA